MAIIHSTLTHLVKDCGLFSDEQPGSVRVKVTPEISDWGVGAESEDLRGSNREMLSSAQPPGLLRLWQVS